MIVQISGAQQLVSPVIEKGESGASLDRSAIPFIRCEFLAQSRYRVGIRSPNLRTLLKPPFPVRSPYKLLYELFGDIKGVMGEDGSNALLLRDNTITNPLGQARDITVPRPIKITLKRV
jgi:hypothetical protein